MQRETNRTKLENAIPLSGPIVVHIETNNTCNFKCKFCFESNEEILHSNGIKRGFMKLDLFKKIIDDLSVLEKKPKRVYFHVAGEPLLHPNIVEMISYAKQKKCADELVMFTNGALLTPKLSHDIVEAGLDVIQISVEGVSSEKYEFVTGVKIDYSKFLENIEILYRECKGKCVLHCKILDVNMDQKEKDKFFEDFSSRCDKCYIENLLDICPEDVMDTTMGQGQSTTQEGYELMEKTVCTIPFYVIDINWNGDVDACSCDYMRKLIMGNVNEQSVDEIWNGKKFNNFRRIQLSGDRKKIKACEECKAILYQLDNIDEYASQLLERI